LNVRIPILQLGRILLTSIQVELSDADAKQFQTDIVQKIAEIEAFGVALDITALDVVDSYMARVINDTASMAQLLGAEVVVCGLQPHVAMTLVQMGRGLIGADCVYDLEQGIARLKERIRQRGDADLDGGV
jgi:rsbT antagonist protein RsbS